MNSCYIFATLLCEESATVLMHKLIEDGFTVGPILKPVCIVSSLSVLAAIEVFEREDDELDAEFLYYKVAGILEDAKITRLSLIVCKAVEGVTWDGGNNESGNSFQTLMVDE